MEMPETDGGAVGSPYECCLSCVVDAALLDTGGLQAPSGIAVLSPFHLDVQDIVFPTSRWPSAPSVLPEVSPPVFLLNSSLLI
jgi:hypothetical protein